MINYFFFNRIKSLLYFKSKISIFNYFLFIFLYILLYNCIWHCFELYKHSHFVHYKLFNILLSFAFWFLKESIQEPCSTIIIIGTFSFPKLFSTFFLTFKVPLHVSFNLLFKQFGNDFCTTCWYFQTEHKYPWNEVVFHLKNSSS